MNYVDPSGHYVISIGFKAEAAAIVGGYGLISVNTDGKYLTICTSIGGKIITNAAASVSILATYYSHKTINGILGWGFSTGISFCFLLKINGNIGVDIGSNGKMTYHGGVGGGAGIGIPVPYWDTEFGYTKQHRKWKLKNVSKRKKNYSYLFQKISFQRVGKHVEVKKKKRTVKIYDSGKVTVK